MATLYDELIKHQNNPHDKRTFGLVLQGGGMRAAYSAGAIAPLVKYGFSDTFDHVIGSSAGAINGAYFIGADQDTMLTYTDDLTNKNFVNLLRHDKKVDIDYLVDTVMKHKRPVNVDRLREAHTKLHIVLTDANTGRKVVISNHRQFEQIYEEFRATAALPMLYDKPVLINGKYYIDGGVSDLIPIDIAVKLGCSDIVVVMTKQLKNYAFDKHHSRLVKHLVKLYAKNQPKPIRDLLLTNEKLLKINLRRITQPHKKIHFYVLEPSDEEILISLATIDKQKVTALAELGVSDMDAFLHKEIVRNAR